MANLPPQWQANSRDYSCAIHQAMQLERGGGGPTYSSSSFSLFDFSSALCVRSIGGQISAEMQTLGSKNFGDDRCWIWSLF